MSRLRSRVVPVASVTAVERARMWEVFEAAYADVDLATFSADLGAKDDVILLEDESGVQGFSTQREVRVVIEGRTHVGVFSGDTVLAPAYWGSRVLGHAFLRYMLGRRLRVPHLPFWWILIAKGYKTYLMMANNFPTHWPRHEAPTPPQVEGVRNAFGGALFAEGWKADEGVVRWARPRGRVKADVADITPELRARPRIAYFEDLNPGWAGGDELLCLAPMDLSMPFRYALKALQRGPSESRDDAARRARNGSMDAGASS
jgi:hypothetical protein